MSIGAIAERDGHGPWRAHRYDVAVPTLERLDTRALREVITTFRDAVRQHAGGLNRLNVYPVPDGDTGTNMARTLDAVVAEMETTSEEDLDATCDAISHGSLMGARGNSGVILSQILRGLVTTLKHGAEASGHKVAEALTAASAGAYQAVLRPIEGTILTVVRESAEAARRRRPAGDPRSRCCTRPRAAGKLALDSTPDLLPVLKDAGVVDAGGAGLPAAARFGAARRRRLAVARARRGRRRRRPSSSSWSHTGTAGAEGELDVSEQRYEVMYFLDLDDDRIDTFKKGWGAIGDSIVVVGGDGLWNCHVHTNDVGAAIEVALDLDGRPRKIRVTDLFERGRRGARRARGVDHQPRRRRAAGGHRRRWSPCAPATASPSCSAIFACRASCPAARPSTRRRPNCSTRSSTSTPSRS